MTNEIAYRGCTLTRTTTTTDVRREVFGHAYPAIAYIWRVTGRLPTPGAPAKPRG